MKIYFWLLALGFFSGFYDLAIGKLSGMDILHFVISSFSLLGLFGYVYNKLYFNKVFWKIYFVIMILDFVLLIVINNFTFKLLATLIGFIFYLPIFYGIYKYLGKFSD